ncbi:MAG: LamG domain-containing protein [Phycisphaerae bacterium]
MSRFILITTMVALVGNAVFGQSIKGIRIDGPTEVVELSEARFSVIAELDNSWEFDVTLDSFLSTNPGVHAQVSVFGNVQTFDVQGDAIESIEAKYSFGSEVFETQLDITVIDASPPDAALSFDSSIDIAIVPANESLAYPGSGGWTIEAWLFPYNNSPFLASPVVGQLSLGMAARDPYVFTIDNGQIDFRVDNAVGASQLISAPIEVHRWTHVAGVYDPEAGIAQLFIDGIEAAREQLNITMESSGSYPILFGGQGDGPRNYDGMLDEFRIWGEARQACDIRAFMHRSLTGQEPTLVGNWSCNEGDGQILNDRSIYANHGTLGFSDLLEEADPQWVSPGADLTTKPFPEHSPGPLEDEIDCDGDVDLDDYAEFNACFLGPEFMTPLGCLTADLDRDEDVDLIDFAKLVTVFNDLPQPYN